MGFFSNLLLAVVSVVNPALGLIGSVIKYVTSEVKNAATGLILSIASTFLPGGFVKDLIVGSMIDAIELDSVSSAVEKVVPRNDLALTCQVCGTNTHHYAEDQSIIKCSTCIEKRVDKKVEHNDRIFVLKNGLYQMEQKKVGEFKFPSLSDKTLKQPNFSGFEKRSFPKF